MRRTETLTLYVQDLITDPTQNVLPGHYQTVFTGLKGNIHRGGTDAKNDAAALGLDIDKAAIGYCDYNPGANWVRNNQLVSSDARPGEIWRIVAEPDFRNRFPRTAHVRFLLRLETQAVNLQPG